MISGLLHSFKLLPLLRGKQLFDICDNATEDLGIDNRGARFGGRVLTKGRVVCLTTELA